MLVQDEPGYKRDVEPFKETFYDEESKVHYFEVRHLIVYFMEDVLHIWKLGGYE